MDFIDKGNQLREKIRLLERKLGVLQESDFSCCSITMSQCHALVEIGRAENISLNDLADVLYLEKSTMSRTVNSLVTSELAKREIDSNDRRYVTISLTDKGIKLFKNIEDDMNFYFKDVYETIPEGKRQQVLESIDVLIEAINENEKCK